MSTAPNPAILPKHQYTVTVELSAPIDACFTAACAEGAMMAWVDNPKSIIYDHSKAAEPYGPGSSRTVTLQNGISVVENIVISQKPNLVGYAIPSLGAADAFIKNYQGRMNFEPLGPSRTRLTWNGYFDCPGWRRLAEPLFRRLLRRLIASMAGNMQRHLASTAAQSFA